MQNFAVEPLDRQDLASAWPLLHVASPAIELERWTEQVQALLDRGGGVLAVIAGKSLVYGLATWQTSKSARLGRVLKVDSLISVELSRRAPVRSALRDHLERIADQTGCSAVIVAAQGGGYLNGFSTKAATIHV